MPACTLALNHSTLLYCTFIVWQKRLLFSTPLSFLQTHIQQQAVKAVSPPQWCLCPHRHQGVRPPAPQAPGGRWAPWRSGSQTQSANSALVPQLKENGRSAKLRESLLLFTATARIRAAPPNLMMVLLSCLLLTENWWEVKLKKRMHSWCFISYKGLVAFKFTLTRTRWAILYVKPLTVIIWLIARFSYELALKKTCSFIQILTESNIQTDISILILLSYLQELKVWCEISPIEYGGDVIPVRFSDSVIFL